MNVSKNSSNRNNDSKLWKFVDLSRHMHSPTRRVKFWPIKIFSRWQPGLVHILRIGREEDPGVKDKQETKKFATHNIRKWKNEIRDRNGKQIVPIRKKYQFHRWYHRWPSRTSPTCAFRKLEARDSEATTKTENWFWQIFSVNAIPSPTTHDCANCTSSTLPTDCNYPCPNREFKFLLGAASGTTESVFSKKRRWLKNAWRDKQPVWKQQPKNWNAFARTFFPENLCFSKKCITECGLFRPQ